MATSAPPGGAPERIFLFRGTAVALGGFINRPAGVEMFAQGSIALPIVGGMADAGLDTDFMGDFNFISCTAAESWGVARFRGHKAETEVNTFVENLTVTSEDEAEGVRNEVRIERISARMISEHHMRANEQTKIRVMNLGSTSNLTNLRGERRPGQTRILGMTINGHAVEVKFAHQLVSMHTYNDMKRAYNNNANKYRTNHKDKFRKPPRHVSGRFPAADDGVVLCHIIKEITWVGEAAPGVVITGNSIYIPNFGTIYLGEMVISACDRRLTMVRMDLGCPVLGGIGGGHIGSDGSTWPP